MAGVFQPGVFQSNVFQTAFISASVAQSLSIGQAATVAVTDTATASQTVGVGQSSAAAVTVSATATQSLGIVSAATAEIAVAVNAAQALGVSQSASLASEVHAQSTSSLSIQSLAIVSIISEGSHGRAYSQKYSKQLFEAEKSLRRRLRTKRDVPFSAPIPEQPRKVVALKPLSSIEELEKLLLQPPPSLAGLQPQEFADDEDAIIALLLAS